ncbi:hypothetical protein CTAYLR_006758 [Chrysophaeum taylorii]|uniref:Uncharacterized protein n=1 Tax=Chrysophaeum taylorii TaxID=2483200 RepID=A0AAD7XKJ6_9STRA|nr:hypothetical protein CTAYLR_006758 [Chrysophaeum taylorii]
MVLALGRRALSLWLAAGPCRTETSALFKTRTCVRTGIQDGRLLSCTPSENCVATSAVKSPSQFGPPWTYGRSNATEAFRDLVGAVEDEGLTIVEVDEDNFYLHATAPTQVRGGRALDLDDVEFKLAPADDLVFYRSASREAIFFFPAQNIYSVPLSDGGSNRARLEAVRKRLGWESLGALYEEADDPSKYQPLDLLS